MVGLIPRLVLDEEEVSKIIHEISDDPTSDSANNEMNSEANENDENKADDRSDGIEDDNPSSILQQISLPGFIADPKKLVEKLQQIMVDLPENLRTAPNVIKKVALELPAHASEFTGNIPSTLAELPTTIITWTSNGQNVITTTVNVIKDLPHRATFQWRHLIGVLTVMILCPLLGEVVFFFPMNPVDDGPDENRVFIYGIMTLYQLFMILPWVKTCSYAMPQVNIPVRARLLALSVGLIIAKLIDVILTEGIFTNQPIFPIPFSILVTGTMGTLPAVPILYFMTPKTDRKKGNFSLMFSLLIAYWLALLAVIGWAIGIQRLQGNPCQYLVLFSYAVFRFVCKVLVCANISTRLQPKRHIQLNLVVDVLFTRVQVATWPFIDSPYTLMALFASESSVILWRYYNGVDRLQLWWNAILTTASINDDEGNEENKLSKRKQIKDITEACFTASNQYIINMSLSEDKHDVIRSLTSCTTSSILGESVTLDSSSVTSNVAEDTHCKIDFDDNGGTIVELPHLCTGTTQHSTMIIESSALANDTIMIFEDDDDDDDYDYDYDYDYDDFVGDICISSSASILRRVRESTDHAATSLSAVSGIDYDHDQVCGDHFGSFHDPHDHSIMEMGTKREVSASIMRQYEGEDISNKCIGIEDSNTSELIGVELDNQPSSSLHFPQPAAANVSLETRPARSTETWEQRDLYHMVDSTGSLCVNIIVRMNQQLIFIAVRNLPSSQHLNQSFQISDKRWREAQTYGSIFILLMLGLVIGINFSTVFFSKKQGLEGKKLSLGRVLSYLFKENFWFFFFWLISTGALVSSAMVNHFGADFTMNFEYLDCLEEIEWPACPS